jgi:hypothetical protein
MPEIPDPEGMTILASNTICDAMEAKARALEAQRQNLHGTETTPEAFVELLCIYACLREMNSFAKVVSEMLEGKEAAEADELARAKAAGLN